MHGITDAMIVAYPGFTDTYRAFSVFVGDAVLLAHNASFDIGFLSLAMAKLG